MPALETLDHICQLIIFVTGVISVYVVNDPDNKALSHKRAVILGFAIQPVYLYACARTGQWGGVLLTPIYCHAWYLGWGKYKIMRAAEQECCD